MKPADKNIPGWGVDADMKNEPTYPMKLYTGDDHRRINWERPILQVSKVEILHSNERPTLSAVYGTTLPPKGISGIIRRYAFKYSESNLGHWLSLLLADRINVIEGILSDLMHGRIPNIYAEKGWKADWKFNRKQLFGKIILRVVILGIIITFIIKIVTD